MFNFFYTFPSETTKIPSLDANCHNFFQRPVVVVLV